MSKSAQVTTEVNPVLLLIELTRNGRRSKQQARFNNAADLSIRPTVSAHFVIVLQLSFINSRLTPSIRVVPDGAVVMSSANGLVGNGFASRYRLQPRGVGGGGY